MRIHPLAILAVLYFPITSKPAFSRGVEVVIAGDSYSAGTVGIKLEKLFKSRGEKVGRYGISSSFTRHWIENSEIDKTMGPGVGVDWASPGQVGEGPAPESFPKLRSILLGEANSAKKLVIILGTNGLCESRTIEDAATLAKQAKETLPAVQCFWVGPKLFTGKCGGDFKRQGSFSADLARAVGSHCTFLDSTKLKIRPARIPHKGDFAEEWANAVAEKFP